jgi:hypothetical protein
MQRVLLLPVLPFVALLLIAANCNGDGSPKETPSSGIEGTVTIGPTCPVERSDTPCPDQPYHATMVVKDSGGSEVARVQSGVDGKFSIAIGPGTYTVAPQSANPGGLPFAREEPVEVRAGAYTSVTIRFDSGIR